MLNTEPVRKRPTMSKPLSEKRAADRAKMAKAVEALALELGCKVERREGREVLAPRGVRLNITAPGGLCVGVEFDGDSPQPDVHVLSWHMELHSEAKLEPSTFGGDVNRHHFQKATYVARGFDDLMFKLDVGLSMCKDGTAYQRAESATVGTQH